MKNSIRILYEDDYPLDREMVRDALKRANGNFQVTEATSRQEFEAHVAEGDYDLLLSDFNISLENLDKLFEPLFTAKAKGIRPGVGPGQDPGGGAWRRDWRGKPVWRGGHFHRQVAR
jgi:hypothetical protein